MLLKVKCSWDNYLKQNPMIVRLTRKVLLPHEPAMRWIKKNASHCLTIIGKESKQPNRQMNLVMY